MSDLAQGQGDADHASEAPRATSRAQFLAGPSGRLLLPVYAGTLFLGAFLIFSLQPLFAKMTLPLLGGVPNVWITASLFFQTTLLLGYVYAHGLSRVLQGRHMVAVHCAVLLVGMAFLPIAVAWTDPSPGLPIFWLIGLLTVSIGLPFFAVAATAPLLQRWFAQCTHDAASDPYFLYGASNLGSMLALLSYPFLIEPLLRLDQQSWIWSSGYVALVAAIAVCGLLAYPRGSGTRCERAEELAAAPPVRWRQRLTWIALAFAPSSLLLGVTNYITTDIGAVPLLWVLPLALYLLTFVLVFARRPLVRHSWMVRLQPLVMVLALLPAVLTTNIWVAIASHLAIFFVTAMVCHGELAAGRPAPGRLTEFFIWLAFGGMLGGLFNAVVAPMAFDGLYEYGIALVVALLLRPGRSGGGPGARLADFAVPLALLAAMLLPEAMFGLKPRHLGAHGPLLFVLAFYFVVFFCRNRPLRYGLSFGVLLLAEGLLFAPPNVLAQERSFFGLYRVESRYSGRVLAFMHGTTQHGLQFTHVEQWDEPLSYFSDSGPLGQLFAVLEGDERVRSVGVVGLGVGTMLCHRQPGQVWTIYEIDPLVGRIAGSGRYFHYLEACGEPATTRIHYGDGRLLLKGVSDEKFDLLILDAFSSDAVPVHLMTREAVALYRRKLGQDGILVFNISNRHLDLSGLLGSTAGDAGMAAWIQEDIYRRPDRGPFDYPSIWVVMTKNADRLAALEAEPRWRRLEPDPDTPPWTDDYSNILGVLR